MTKKKDIYERGPRLVGGLYLKKDWKRVAKRAWSTQLMAAAILLTGFEAGLPFLKELGLVEWLPAGVFALISCFVVMAAFAARLIAQKNFHEC